MNKIKLIITLIGLIQVISCGNGDRLKIKMALVDEPFHIGFSLKFNDTTINVKGIGDINIGKTNFGLNAGYIFTGDSLNNYLFYWDSDGDNIPDPETRISMVIDSVVFIRIPVQDWTDTDSLSYSVRMVRYKDKSTGCFFLPHYYRSGIFHSGEEEYQLNLYDLGCKAKFSIEDYRMGTNIAFRERGLEKLNWKNTGGLIMMGNSWYRVVDIKPDGSRVILEKSAVIIPSNGERFNALDIKRSMVGEINLDTDKYTLFQFWYTRCAICLKKFPELVRWADTNSDRIDVIGICVDDTASFEKAKHIVEDYNIPWTQHYISRTDPFWIISGAVPAESEYFLPRYILVDGKGIIINSYWGAPDYNDFLKFPEN